MKVNIIKEGFRSNECPTLFKFKDMDSFGAKFGSPKEFPEKSLVPLWNLAEYTPTPFQEELTSRQNFNVGLLRQKFLLLDFDSKMEKFIIERVLEHFSKYNFWFYTSYNNTPEVPKFRIILEMGNWYTRDDLHLIKTNYNLFKRFFLLDDKTTFEIKRWFCVPALNPLTKQHYQFAINKGIPYPDDELEYYLRVCRRTLELQQEKQEQQMQQILKDRKSGKYDEEKQKQRAENYAHKQLNSMADGSKHDTRLRINGFLHKTRIFTNDEIFAIMSEHCNTSELVEKTRKLVYNYRE